jgi:hypothetical protein
MVYTLKEKELEQIIKEAIKTTITKEMLNGGKMSRFLGGLGLGAALSLGLPSCHHLSSGYEENWETVYRTTEENREYVWQFHYDNGDWETTPSGVGYCYWSGTRCANSGGGYTVCVVFKDKSYGTFILPQDAKMPNHQCKNTQYTTDRIDTNGLQRIDDGGSTTVF